MAGQNKELKYNIDIETIQDTSFVEMDAEFTRAMSQMRQRTYRYEVYGRLAKNKNIHEFYTVGDLMVTKPGGITLSEVVAKKIPVILYNPTPGQEGENAQWFKQQGAAVVVQNATELFLAIDALKSNELKRFSMKNMLGKIDYGPATPLITSDILMKLDADESVSYLTESI